MDDVRTWHAVERPEGLAWLDRENADALYSATVDLKIKHGSIHRPVRVSRLKWVPGKPGTSGYYEGADACLTPVVLRDFGGQWSLCWPCLESYEQDLLEDGGFDELPELLGQMGALPSPSVWPSTASMAASVAQKTRHGGVSTTYWWMRLGVMVGAPVIILSLLAMAGIEAALSTSFLVSVAIITPAGVIWATAFNGESARMSKDESARVFGWGCFLAALSLGLIFVYTRVYQ